MKIPLALLLLLAAPSFAQTLPPPLLGPPKINAYGLGVNSDATGRPFRYTVGQDTLPIGQDQVRPNAYGLGVGADQYGRPVDAKPLDDGDE